jgi:hypothetical protein
VLEFPEIPLDVAYLSRERAELLIGFPDDKRFGNRKFQFDKSVFLVQYNPETVNPSPEYAACTILSALPEATLT